MTLPTPLDSISHTLLDTHQYTMAHRTQAPASIKHASAVDVYNLPLVEYWLVIDTRSAGAWKEGEDSSLGHTPRLAAP